MAAARSPCLPPRTFTPTGTWFQPSPRPGATVIRSTPSLRLLEIPATRLITTSPTGIAATTPLPTHPDRSSTTVTTNLAHHLHSVARGCLGLLPAADRPMFRIACLGWFITSKQPLLAPARRGISGPLGVL